MDELHLRQLLQRMWRTGAPGASRFARPSHLHHPRVMCRPIEAVLCKSRAAVTLHGHISLHASQPPNTQVLMLAVILLAYTDGMQWDEAYT